VSATAFIVIGVILLAATVVALVLCKAAALGDRIADDTHEPTRFAPDAVHEVGQACDAVIFDWLQTPRRPVLVTRADLELVADALCPPDPPSAA
jgi:hypothetical protein